MMETESDQTTGARDPRRHSRESSRSDDPGAWPGGPSGPRPPDGDHADPRRSGREVADLLDEGPGGQQRSEGYRGRHAQPAVAPGRQRPGPGARPRPRVAPGPGPGPGPHVGPGP